ncbi:MAG TPA: hypothetical protein VMA73_14620 [Streptosporangiaceae bacterium]|nr:hypothetical protein [Streptosporangiaceae bacterium]
MGNPDYNHPTNPEHRSASSEPTMPILATPVLAYGLLDLMVEAAGLAMPYIASIDEPSQMFALELAPSKASIEDIIAWSARFGGVLQAHPCEVRGEPCQHVSTSFPFHSVTVSVYAFIPDDDTWTWLEDQL